MSFFKPAKPVRNKAYLRWVSERVCCCCGGTSGVVPHHLLRAPGKGMGVKSADNYVLPLCWVHHSALHGSGNENAFLAGWGIEFPAEQALALYNKYLLTQSKE